MSAHEENSRNFSGSFFRQEEITRNGIIFAAVEQNLFYREIWFVLNPGNPGVQRTFFRGELETGADFCTYFIHQFFRILASF